MRRCLNDGSGRRSPPDVLRRRHALHHGPRLRSAISARPVPQLRSSTVEPARTAESRTARREAGRSSPNLVSQVAARGAKNARVSARCQGAASARTTSWPRVPLRLALARAGWTLDRYDDGSDRFYARALRASRSGSEPFPRLDGTVPVDLARVHRPGLLGVVHGRLRCVVGGAADRIPGRRDSTGDP
jgi:hypothetical protein